MGNTLNLLPHLDIVDGIAILENGKAEVGIRIELPSVLFATGEDKLEADWRNMRNLLHMALPLGYRARYYLEAALDRGEALRWYREAVDTPFNLAKEIAESRARFLERERARGKLLRWGAYLTVSAPIAPKKRVTFTPVAFEEMRTNMLALRQRVLEFIRAGGWEA